MPLYRYRALNEAGRKTSGVIDADTLSLAKERLRREKILVTTLEPLRQQRMERTLDSEMLLAFTRELSQLLSAGLPLYEGLLTIEEKYRRHRCHPLLLTLADQLKAGHAFSAVLKQYPKTFDPVYLSMVEAGEKTGSLAWVFDQLKDLVERRQKLRKKLMGALAYPLFLFGFCILVVLSLLLFVIPSMAELFEGRQLHPITHLVLSTSAFLIRRGGLLLCFLGLFIGGAILFFKQKRGKTLLQLLLLRMPFLKQLITEAALIRFCRSASVLLQGGIPLLQGLATARRTLNSPSLEQVIEKAEERIVEGESFSAQLKNSSLIPPLVPRMLALAEETGKMAPMLHHVAEIYDQELERNLNQLTTFLQPALLLVLGALVGIVILSILLPLTDMGSITT